MRLCSCITMPHNSSSSKDLLVSTSQAQRALGDIRTSLLICQPDQQSLRTWQRSKGHRISSLVKIWGSGLGWGTREMSIVDQSGSKPGGTFCRQHPTVTLLCSRLPCNSGPFLSRSSGPLQALAVTAPCLPASGERSVYCYFWVLRGCHTAQHSWNTGSVHQGNGYVHQRRLGRACVHLSTESPPQLPEV